MSLAFLRPARQQRIEDSKVLVDLDRLVSESVGFRLNGKVHTIKPMTTETFFKVANELAKLSVLRSETEVDQKAVIGGYISLFESVCDTISKKDVYQMSQPQIAALFQQILNCITGTAYRDDEEKKTPLPPQ